MIKGVILDVDGVLVGDKEGYNWPSPHLDVIKALQSLRAQGFVISLCTGKGTFAIREIVERAHLDNLHIGDGGAVIIDFLNKQIIEKHTIPSSVAKKILQIYHDEGIYLELYTTEGYFVEKASVCEITEKHSAILYRKPTIVDSFDDIVSTLEIVKIMPVAIDEVQKKNVTQKFSEYMQQLTLQWGVHPTALPLQFGIITLQGISKSHAAQIISQTTGVSLTQMLGIGDGLSDWGFMELCGYAGAMGNASKELKELVNGRDTGYIGRSVNENGVLDIMKHFNILSS